jgi:two-component system sensor histidine kinase MtrB
MRLPRRFRRRLTAAFVLVAATAAGVLGALTYALSTQYRFRSFEHRSHDETEVALALAPEELTEQSFQRLQAAYESRTGASTIARSGPAVYSSSPGLALDDVPTALSDPSRDVASVKTRVDGTERLVLAAHRREADYWFFFSTAEVTASLADLRTILVLGWLITVAAAAVVGRSVARRTLAPVRVAADAARSVASGLLETRLAGHTNDEFGEWRAAFDEMAAELETTFDRLAQAAERERRFTADVAHELRTPLTSMAAAASLLEDDVDQMPPRSRRAATVLLAEVTSLRDLVLELLELARLDAGSEPLELEVLDLRRALQAAVDGMPNPPAEDVVISGGAGVVVRTDRSRFRRITANLLDNARIHGGPPVEVQVRCEPPWAIVDVRDHGPGFGAQEPGHLFDRFAKSDASRASGGSGLGLAIAAGHAEAMGAELSASDAGGDGACFTLRVPLAEP